MIGREFDLTTLRLASARSEDETVVAVEELTRRGIVRELPAVSRSGRYDFTHRRMRDVAYESMSMARRRLLHGRIAADLAHGQATEETVGAWMLGSGEHARAVA